MVCRCDACRGRAGVASASRARAMSFPTTFARAVAFAASSSARRVAPSIRGVSRESFVEAVHGVEKTSAGLEPRPGGAISPARVAPARRLRYLGRGRRAPVPRPVRVPSVRRGSPRRREIRGAVGERDGSTRPGSPSSEARARGGARVRRRAALRVSERPAHRPRAGGMKPPRADALRAAPDAAARSCARRIRRTTRDILDALNAAEAHPRGRRRGGVGRPAAGDRSAPMTPPSRSPRRGGADPDALALCRDDAAAAAVVRPDDDDDDASPRGASAPSLHLPLHLRNPRGAARRGTRPRRRCGERRARPDPGGRRTR